MRNLMRGEKMRQVKELRVILLSWLAAISECRENILSGGFSTQCTGESHENERKIKRPRDIKVMAPYCGCMSAYCLFLNWRKKPPPPKSQEEVFLMQWNLFEYGMASIGGLWRWLVFGIAERDIIHFLQISIADIKWHLERHRIPIFFDASNWRLNRSDVILVRGK